MKWVLPLMAVLAVGLLACEVIMAADMVLNHAVGEVQILSFWFGAVMLGFGVGVVVSARMNR